MSERNCSGPDARRGFTSLAEVQQYIIEPGGTLSLFGKKTLPAEQRHHELLERFGRLVRELASCVVVKQHPQA